MPLKNLISHLSHFYAITASLVFGLVLFGSLTADAVTINEFRIGSVTSAPYGITAGSDGNLWFTESTGNKIGRITTSGAITEFPIPTTGSQPYGIAAGSDGNLWFTELGTDKIGRITTSGVITEFTIPTIGGAPTGITAGSDGNLWFTEQVGNKIGRITTSGAITEFTLPTAGSEPWGITAGSDGNLWFTEAKGNKIGRITTSGVITEFTLPTGPYSDPTGITAGSDGNLWFTEYNGDKIGRITTSGAITEFTLPTTGSQPYGIAAGSDGNLWFTEFNGNKIGRITTAGVITEFTLPTADSNPHGITAGSDGNLWFTEQTGNEIGRITTAGVITEFTLTVSSEPFGITAGPDGNLWFTEFNGNKIGRITTAGAITEFTIPTGPGGPTGITAGSDGNLWFTEYSGNKIGRITTAGVITEFTIPTAGSEPWGITAGPDGNLWFTEYLGNKIGRITTAGAITEFTIPTGPYSDPTGITAGPDGNLWFTEQFGNKIGRITTAGAITEFTVPTAGSAPTGITAGPDGNLWFTEYPGDKIGRITTAGVITEFTLTVSSGPFGITAGPDGNLWFTEYSGNKIGRITTAGVITEFTITTAGSSPNGITAGPDSNLWFTEQFGSKIGRATLCETFTINPVELFAPYTGDVGYTVSVMPSESYCSWTATSNNPSWITITGGSSGTGNGIVTFDVGANTGIVPPPPRTGTITIAGQTLTVNQGSAEIIEQITGAPSTVRPGEPIWVKTRFKNDSDTGIYTIKPDCYNTYFWVTDSSGNMVIPWDIIGPPYGIPDDVVYIPAHSFYPPLGPLSCDISNRYPALVGPANYNVIATFANYIRDPDYNSVTHLCSNPDRTECYDLWTGAAGSGRILVGVLNTLTVQQVPATCSFNPIMWCTQWTSPDVTAYISNIEGHDVSDVIPSSILLNGIVPIKSGASIVGDVLKVEFDGGLAVQSLGTAVPGTTVYPTVQGSFYSTPYEIFSANGTVILYGVLSGVLVLQPNGGEVIPSGSIYNIKWDSAPDAVKFDVGYSCTGTWNLIADNVTDHNYYWIVPTPMGNQNNCRVGVRGRNSVDAIVDTDTSDNPFTIEVVRVIYPNGGEILSAGCQTVNITWQTNATAGSVYKTMIYGSTNGGATWKLLNTLSGNPGSYQWITPHVGSPKTNCKIGVVLKDALGNTLGRDASDSSFTIQP